VKWGHWIEEAFGKIGRPFLPIEKYKEVMEDTGFVNVQLRMVKRPTNDWPKDPRQKEIGKVRARVWKTLNLKADEFHHSSAASIS